MNYLVDTDIFIDWLRGKKSVIKFFQETKGIFYYSAITRKELLSSCNSASEKEKILNLLRTMRIIRVDPAIAVKASEFLNEYSNNPLYKSDSFLVKFISTFYFLQRRFLQKSEKGPFCHSELVEELRQIKQL